MKIRIQSDGRDFSILLPTRMLFSKSILRFALRVGRKYSADVPDIPPATVDALCDEIRRIKKKHGSWELVNVQSAGGEQVQIIL